MGELETFDINSGDIAGDEGVSIIARSLAAKTCLNNVYFVGVGMTDAGVAALCDSLPLSVTILGLIYNRVTDEGAALLGAKLPAKLPRLKHMWLEGNDITAVGEQMSKCAFP